MQHKLIVLWLSSAAKQYHCLEAPLSTATAHLPPVTFTAYPQDLALVPVQEARLSSPHLSQGRHCVALPDDLGDVCVKGSAPHDLPRPRVAAEEAAGARPFEVVQVVCGLNLTGGPGEGNKGCEIMGGKQWNRQPGRDPLKLCR